MRRGRLLILVGLIILLGVIAAVVLLPQSPLGVPGRPATEPTRQPVEVIPTATPIATATETPSGTPMRCKTWMM